MTGLTFDPETHTYRWHGEIVPSVTQILAAEGLIDSRHHTPEAALRGQYVAQATWLDDQGQLDYAALDDRLRGYVDAWRKFRVESRFEMLAGEERVVSPFGTYAGTLDRRGTMTPGKGMWLLDGKTGAPCPWHPIQTAAYSAAKGADLISQRGAVYLHDDGTYKLVLHNNYRDYDVWNAALTLYLWKRKNSKGDDNGN